MVDVELSTRSLANSFVCSQDSRVSRRVLHGDALYHKPRIMTSRVQDLEL